MQLLLFFVCRPLFSERGKRLEAVEHNPLREPVSIPAYVLLLKLCLLYKTRLLLNVLAKVINFPSRCLWSSSRQGKINEDHIALLVSFFASKIYLK